MSTPKKKDSTKLFLKKGDIILTNDKQVGVIKYIGEIESKKSSKIWYGIEIRMTEGQMGDNDGSINGKKYFECQQECGLFISLV